MPSSGAFQARFGGLIRAYSLVGYTPALDYSYIETNRNLRKQHPKVVAEVVAQLESQGSIVEQDNETGLLLVNREIMASLVLSRCTTTNAGSRRWNIRLEHGLKPDITIAARMDDENESALDYYLLPSIDMNKDKLRLADENGAYLDVYRYENLDFFYQLASRVTLEWVA